MKNSHKLAGAMTRAIPTFVSLDSTGEIILAPEATAEQWALARQMLVDFGDGSQWDWEQQRRREYPSLADQLDALWKGGQALDDMRARVNAVKTKYPKPEQR